MQKWTITWLVIGFGCATNEFEDDLDSSVALANLDLAPEADTFVRSGRYAGREYGSSSSVQVDLSSSQTTKRGYLRFPASAPGVIEHATLRLYVTNGSSNSADLVRTSNVTWNEATTNWNNQPAADGETIATLGATSSGWLEVDVTSAVSSEAPLSFAVVPRSSDSFFFASKESATPPALVVEFSETPTDPTDPSPTEPGPDIVLEAEDMPIKTTGTAITGGWNIWSEGYIAQNVDFPSTGTYKLTVRAAGSVALGVWPNMEVRLDGTVLGSADVTSTSYVDYEVTGAVAAGTHQVAVAFTNDYWDGGSVDRNLYVDRVVISGGATTPADPTPEDPTPGPTCGDGTCDASETCSTCTSDCGSCGGPVGCRDPIARPFSSNSIWNLPIGAGAVYVDAEITEATSWGMTVDPDVLILTPGAPITPVYYNDDAWSGGSRCAIEGGVLFSAPIPPSFIIPGASGGSTPNFATAILGADGATLYQGQPTARCTAGGPVTMWWYQSDENIYGTGFSGAHGASMLSSIGGTIRLGELVPGGVIRHTLKVNLYGAANYFYDGETSGYRWPATTADAAAPWSYGGSNPALRMGSLLALAPSIDIAAMGLETEPARILAQTFQDYGGYVVDDTSWSVYALSTEFSPSGRVEDEFDSVWGFSMVPSSQSTPWARDMDRIFLNLSVVNNWNASLGATVMASGGAQGAGGGAPRVPWAPPTCSP